MDYKISCRVGSRINDGDIYYDAVSYKSYISKLKSKTLFISDMHDPVIGSDCVPADSEFMKKPNVALLKTSFGGHCAYFDSLF